MALPAGREGEAPPLPGIVEVRLPVGFYNEPAPDVPGLYSMPVADWLGGGGTIDVELVRRNAHSAASSWAHLLTELPPLFPLP